ncbi:invasion associated locus B family protein [Magnetovibrio sp.]|uniref:invasion associated locus B family protein n=1 Tax=Magnetovibrio sp. TaxID=2024836 RepID=UPI002F95CABE
MSKRLFINTVFLLALSAHGAHGETLLESGDWQAIKELENGNPVCVMSAEPQKSEGKYTQRGTALTIISHRPKEKRIGEVGFQAGYTFKSGSEPTATIDGKTTFKLFTQGGHAWALDAAADKALVAAMRAGGTLVVKGVSSRGTETTDTYSLKGFTAAWNAINKACGVK